MTVVMVDLPIVMVVVRVNPGCLVAFTRYCHLQYCMVYGIQRRGRWEGVYCAMVVQ